MSEYTIDWSRTDVDGNNTISGSHGDIHVSISTPKNGEGKQWFVDNGMLKNWDVTSNSTADIRFSQEVENISFTLLDVDALDKITIMTKDADGNAVPVEFEVTGNHDVNGNMVTGAQTTTDGPSDSNDQQDINVTIAGPVSTFWIVLDDGPERNYSGTVAVSDIHFDLANTEDGYVDGTSGNDVIDVAYADDPDGDRIDNDDQILPGEATNDDIVLAGNGDDTVVAGEGNDEIYGGKGDDMLFAGFDDDVVFGGKGADKVQASKGDDIVFGGEGNDELWAGKGDDIVSGGTGNDSITTGLGDDLAAGGKGNDTIDAGDGEDVVYGGAGSDSISGGADNDTLIGGNVAFDGTLDFNTLDAGELVDGQFVANGVMISSADAHNPVMAFDTANPTGGDHDLATDNLGTVLILSEDRDGSDPDDNGGGGTFNIDFDAPADVTSLTLLDVDYGATVKYYDEQGNLLQEVDVETADNGQHVVETNLSGVCHIEVILGGSGAIDNLTYSIAPGTDDGNDIIAGGDGDDYIEGNAGNDELFGDAGEDTIFGNSGKDEIYGGADNDTIEGGGGSDDLYGDAGDDEIYGGAGQRDDLFGGDGNDTLFGGDGLDVIFGGDGDDEAFGGAGHSEMFMGDGDDLAVGGDSTDWLHGEAGNDTLIGGAGADMLKGGDDRDVLFADGDDTVVDGGAGGDDFDTLNIEGLGAYYVAGPDGTGAPVEDSNGNGIDGTIVFVDADGVPTGETIGFTEIEQIIGDDEINRGPDADDDTAATDEDTPVIIDVLGNDSDPDGDALTVTGATSPDGNVTINADGTITFTPDDDFNGETTITYTIDDGNGGTDTATVTVTVGAVNDGPVATDDDDATDQDTSIVLDNVLGNDTDDDGDTLEVVRVDGMTGKVGDPVAGDNGGLITINADGSATFDPNGEFDALGNGDTTTTSVTYTISDGNGGTDTATVTVTVTGTNDAPVANTQTETTPFNTAITVDLLANDSDVDGDTLSVVSASVPANEGSLVDNGDGTVTFTPVVGFTGTATISYTIEDEEGLQASSTHLIIVEAGLLDGTVNGTAGDDVIDEDYNLDPEGDFIDNNDAIVGDAGSNDDIVEAGAGNDTVFAGAGDDTVFGGADNDMVFGGTGDDTLYGEDGDDKLEGSGGDDELYGGDGNDDLWGGANDDIVSGGAGDDTITGGGGNDMLTGGTGDDSINGGNNDDMLFGGAGDDILEGGTGDDKIEGGSGDDTIEGGIGDDDLWGASGDDSVSGGKGNDTIATAEGNDIVEGGDGDDIIDTANDENPFTTDPGQNLPDVGYPGVYPADEDPSDDLDTVFGGAGNDSIITGDDDDTIFGGTGDDTIDSGIDDDYVEGGDGDDTITASEGNDEVYGGEGDDTIYGGLEPGVADQLNLPDDIDLVDFNNNDTLFGGAGDDTIYGADDDDTLYGDDGDDTLIGGVDEDEQFGGQGSDRFIIDEEGHGAGDVIVGGEDPDNSDVDVLDLTGSNVDFITYEDDDPEAGVVTFLDGSTMTFSEIENVIPCFTPGTTIATPRGERLVEDLREGDRIITRDNGIQEIRWVGRKDMSGKALVANPHLKPILVRAGSLGNGLPERDMLVSPNHRMLVASEKTQLYFEEREVLAAAKHLVGSEGIHAVDVMNTSYIHFMFDRHEVVLSSGAWTESFQPGDYSLKGIGNAQRTEIFELFPELQEKKGLEGYQSARRALKKHEAKLLVK